MTHSKAFTDTMKIVRQDEGGFANLPGDHGRETYVGIARAFWPQWPGWKIVDSLRSYPDFPRVLAHNAQLQSLVDEFYYQNFWLKIGGDRIAPDIAQAIMSDTINAGIPGGIRCAEQLVGLPPTGKISQNLVTRLNTLKA